MLVDGWVGWSDRTSEGERETLLLLLGIFSAKLHISYVMVFSTVLPSEKRSFQYICEQHKCVIQ